MEGFSGGIVGAMVADVREKDSVVEGDGAVGADSFWETPTMVAITRMARQSFFMES